VKGGDVDAGFRCDIPGSQALEAGFGQAPVGSLDERFTPGLCVSLSGGSSELGLCPHIQSIT
jgi:hypothetical protein